MKTYAPVNARVGRIFAAKVCFTLGLTAVVGIGTAAPAGNELIINKQVVSTDVRIIGGRAYAPIGDIAKALDMKVVQNGGSFELTREGGATQIANKLIGKTGQELFSGEWRFQVNSVETTNEYKPAYNGELYVVGHQLQGSSQRILPKKGDKLIVVHCRIKNGTGAKQTMAFLRDPDAVPTFPALNTALTDTDEQSFALYATDVHVDDSYYGLIKTSFLPGAAISFNLLFSVPPATRPKDLIYSATRVIGSTNIDDKHVANFRVTLAPEER